MARRAPNYGLIALLAASAVFWLFVAGVGR